MYFGQSSANGAFLISVKALNLHPILVSEEIDDIVDVCVVDSFDSAAIGFWSHVGEELRDVSKV